MGLWFDEIYEDQSRIGLKVNRTLFSGQSEYQRVDIVETAAYGRALLLDGMWMTAEGEEHTYHEMIVHPALTTAPRIERVLVIGGGDGGTVREVLRHPEVQHVDMVEIDAMVIEACQAHLPTIGTAWDDPRLVVRAEDGVAFIKNAAPASYDVILVDGADPVGPAEGLFNEAFFAACKRALTPAGVLVTQSGSPVAQRDIHVALVRTIGGVFATTRPYFQAVPLYPGALWSWTYASDAVDPAAVDAARAERVAGWAEIYNAEVHQAAFAVPNGLKKAY